MKTKFTNKTKHFAFYFKQLRCLFFLLLGNLLFSSNTFSQSSGIFESYAILSLNGASNTYYDMQASTANEDFNGKNFGLLTSSNSLVIKGGQNKTFKNGGCDITDNKIFYRIYLTSSPSGTYININLPFASNLVSAGDQQWEGTSGTSNLLTGLANGNYTIEIYSNATYNGCGTGTHFSSNSGANYKATFNYCNTPTVGGSVGSSVHVCRGTNSTILNLTGHTGDVLKWQSSADGTFTDAVDITNTSTTYTATNLTSNISYRAVVQNGVCTPENSASATLEVDLPSVGGTVNSSITHCNSTNTTTLNLGGGYKGSVIKWQSSLDNFATAGTDIANTDLSHTVNNLAVTTSYRAVVQRGVCPPENSNSATISISNIKNLTTNDCFATIQNAIDEATANDIVQIPPGTYAEDLVIDKNLTFQFTANNDVTFTSITVASTFELKHNKSFTLTTFTNNGIYTGKGFNGKLVNTGTVSPKQP